MKIHVLITVFLIVLIGDNSVDATLEDTYNQVQQRPSYDCGNGYCLPSGNVQGNHLVDPITHLLSCIGSGCQGELNPCDGKGYGGICDEALAGNQGNAEQIIQPLKNFCANGIWDGNKCEENGVKVGDYGYISAVASGGQPPYTFKLYLVHQNGATDLSNQIVINGNISTFKFYPTVAGRYDFSFDVIDSTGQQMYNFTEMNVIDDSTTVGSSNLGGVSLQNSQGFQYQSSSQAYTAQNTGQSSQNQIHQTQLDNSFWLDLVVGLGVAICIAIVGIVTLKFWTAVRIHTQQREREKERVGRAINRSAIGNNSENIDHQIERASFFTDEWFRNLQNQFPRDYAKILDWVKRNPDETRKIRQMSETEREEQRRIVKAWKSDAKSIKCTCGATFSDEDKYISHLKKTGHEGLT